jgi:hypothetical protein
MAENDKGFRLESLKELGWPDDHRLLKSGWSWMEASWGDGKGRGGEGDPLGMQATLSWDADDGRGTITVIDGLEISFMADVVLDDEGLFVRDAWGPGADGQRSPMAAKDAAEAFKTAISLLTPVVPKRTTRRGI